MYLLAFIFVMELLFGLLPQYSSRITSLIGSIFFKISEEERKMRSEITDLKEKQSGLNVTDDFAKYAKIQRQVDKLLNQVRAKGMERKSYSTYLGMGISVVTYVVHGMAVITLMLSMRSEPILLFPPSYFSPLSSIVGFPTGISGAVGLAFWFAICNSVISRIKSYSSLRLQTAPVRANIGNLREPDLD